MTYIKNKDGIVWLFNQWKEEKMRLTRKNEEDNRLGRRRQEVRRDGSPYFFRSRLIVSHILHFRFEIELYSIFNRHKAVHTIVDNMFRSVSLHVQYKDTVRTNFPLNFIVKPALLTTKMTPTFCKESN